MDTRVVMLTALGDDSDRARIDREADEFGIDLSRAITVPGAGNQTYLYICGPDGDMEMAVNDMELLHCVDCAYIERELDIINASAAIVIDANLDPEVLRLIADKCTVPIFADPVSVSKAGRMRDILGRLYAFKPNLIEGEALSNVKITDRASLERAAAVLNDIGIKHLYLSLGKNGVCCSCKTDADEGTPSNKEKHRIFYKPCLTDEIANATGGGDAMMAAIVKGFLLGLSDEDAAALAMAASAMAVESPSTINIDISLDKLIKRAGLRL